MGHVVSFAIPKRDLGRADVVFDVKQDGKKVGRLEVSRGAVVWFPKDHSYGYKMNWTRFDQLMRESGRDGAEKR